MTRFGRTFFVRYISSFQTPFRKREPTTNRPLPPLIQTDSFRRRRFGQTGHRHDIAGMRNDKARSRGQRYVPHLDSKIVRGSEKRCLIREGIRGFRHAHRQAAKSEALELPNLRFRLSGQLDAFAAVDFPHDGFNFCPDIKLFRIQRRIPRRLTPQNILQGPGHFQTSLAAFSPNIGQLRPNPHTAAGFGNQPDFILRIVGIMVYSHHHGNSEFPDVLQMPSNVG